MEEKKEEIKKENLQDLQADEKVGGFVLSENSNKSDENLDLAIFDNDENLENKKTDNELKDEKSEIAVTKFKKRNFDIAKKSGDFAQKMVSENKKNNSFDSVSKKTKQVSQPKKSSKKSFSIVYPMAIFFFFLFLLGFSVFIQYSLKENPNFFSLENFKKEKDNFFKKENSVSTSNSTSNLKKIEKAESLSKNSTRKNNDKENGILAVNNKETQERVIFQPVRKANSQDLSLEDATSAVILDVDSGKILFSKNVTEKRSIASLTKLVTAMITIDRVQNLDEEVIIPAQALKVDGTKVGCSTSYKCEYEKMYVGEKVKVRDLLKSMLMLSANDAATTLAIHISGSEEEFAKLMNSRMKELGMVNSNFCRPSGLELDEEKGNEENCYSTSYDISRVMAHILKYKKYDVLFQIMKTEEDNFTSLDAKKTTHTLKNTNKILNEFSGILGGKTGFTSRAGYSLAMALENPNKNKIVCVVLNDNKRFNDIKKMADWTFNNFEWK